MIAFVLSINKFFLYNNFFNSHLKHVFASKISGQLKNLFFLSFSFVHRLYIQCKMKWYFLARKETTPWVPLKKVLNERRAESLLWNIVTYNEDLFHFTISIELRTMSAIYYILIFPCFFLAILNWFGQVFLWMNVSFLGSVPSRKLGYFRNESFLMVWFGFGILWMYFNIDR